MIVIQYLQNHQSINPLQQLNGLLRAVISVCLTSTTPVAYIVFQVQHLELCYGACVE